MATHLKIRDGGDQRKPLAVIIVGFRVRSEERPPEGSVGILHKTLESLALPLRDEIEATFRPLLSRSVAAGPTLVNESKWSSILSR